MRNIFLIFFYLFGILYCYGKITNNNLAITTGIYGIVPSIILHYLFNSQNKNLIYLVALVSSYIGDITFYKNDINIDLISLGGFITFNLLILVIVYEKMKLVKFRKVFIISPILILIFMVTTYAIFDTIDHKFLAISIYFISLSLLVSFCIQYYINTKSKISLYFLIGAISYIIASISKEFEYVDSNNTLIIIINIAAYLATHHFYYSAILKCDNKLLDEKLKKDY